MYHSILNYIHDSCKQLGFPFTKRDNQHLLDLCAYFDEHEYDQMQAEDVANIDANCNEGDKTIANNKRILWNALKDWAQQEGALLPTMQKMGAMFTLLAIPQSEEVAAKPRNLELARAQTQLLLEDAEFSVEDMNAILLTIKHLHQRNLLNQVLPNISKHILIIRKISSNIRNLSSLNPNLNLSTLIPNRKFIISKSISQ